MYLSSQVIGAGSVVAQLLGETAATAMFRWLVPSLPRVAERVIGRPQADDELTCDAISLLARGESVSITVLAS